MCCMMLGGADGERDWGKTILGQKQNSGWKGLVQTKPWKRIVQEFAQRYRLYPSTVVL